MEERRPVTGSGPEGSIASDISAEVGSIVSAAESAAGAIRRRAEQDAQVRRRETEVEARDRLTRAAVEADQLVVERLRRISELSDSVVERARAVVDQLDQADEARRQLNALLAALAKTAERVARELDDGGPGPRPADPPAAAPVAAVAPQEQPGPVRIGARSTDDASGDRADVQIPPASREPQSPPPLVDEASAASSPAVPAWSERDATAEVVELPRPVAVSAEAPAQVDSRSGPGTSDMDGARLVALQMAVAGSTRGEVASLLKRQYDIVEPHGILDDVFGENH